MISITLQDLRYRARQFLIAVLGASLVFAMSMLLSGLAAGFDVEVEQTVNGTGAAAWVMAPGSTGRISALPPMTSAVARDAQIALVANGVKRVGSVVIAPQAALVRDKVTSVILVGYALGGLGSPPIVSGRVVTRSGEAVVDSRMKLGVGGSFVVSGVAFKVVGLVEGRTLLGGLPEAYVSLGDAQGVVYGGRPLVGAVLASSVPPTIPDGLTVMTDHQIESRTISQMGAAVSSIDNSRSFMWFIAAVIVAALVYVAALERTRDFAIMKALGSSSAALFGGLALQAVVLSLVSALLAAALSQFMTGLFSQPVDIPSSAFVVLPISALVVGLLASLVALRRAVSVDPAMAFAGA